MLDKTKMKTYKFPYLLFYSNKNNNEVKKKQMHVKKYLLHINNYNIEEK